MYFTPLTTKCVFLSRAIFLCPVPGSWSLAAPFTYDTMCRIFYKCKNSAYNILRLRCSMVQNIFSFKISNKSLCILLSTLTIKKLEDRFSSFYLHCILVINKNYFYSNRSCNIFSTVLQCLSITVHYGLYISSTHN